MQTSLNAAAPPFSRMIDVTRVGAEGLDLTLTARPAECAALARQDGLVAIASFEARFTLRREGRTGISVRGEVRAEITQTCVVTLDPFDSAIREAVDVHFLPEAEVRAMAERMPGPSAAEADPLALDHDLPDPIIGGRIDLGALASEFLALSLDPYPRKPGAALPASAAEPALEEETASPFAALIRLKSGPASDG